MGLLSFLFGGQKEANKYKATIEPQLAFANSMAQYGNTTGRENLGKATGQIDSLMKYFQDILEGTPDHLLKDIDASYLTQSMDDTLQNTIQNGVRGGARAGSISQAQFDKNAAINRAIQTIRQQAPEHLQSLAQLLAGVGSEQLGIGIQGNQDAASLLNNVQSVKETEKARKAGIFKAYLEAAAGVAGAAAA